MNKFVTAIVLMLIAFSAMSQDTVYANIERAYKDPERKKNSAKADVFIMGKRIHDEGISASASTLQPVKNQKPAINNRRKKK